jgi:hypothetical protein
MAKHRATVQVSDATRRNADCNSRGGKTPYSSGPACGKGKPPILPIPRACCRRRNAGCNGV